MAVQYKAKAIGKPGVKGGGEIKYYASIDREKRVEFPMILEEIAELNVAHPGAILAVMETFISRIYYHVINGRGVEIGQLGTFYPSITSFPAETPNEVRSENIKRFKVIFRPSKRLKKQMTMVEFEKIANGSSSTQA